LEAAQLQGVDLQLAQLQGANLWQTQLHGAYLEAASLQGAVLKHAQLQGAVLFGAELQAADLGGAELQGADLGGAELQGANLRQAQLQGADLQSAELYGALIEQTRTALVDLRAARWTPIEQERLAQIRQILSETIADPGWREEALERMERAANAGIPRPFLESCLIDSGVTPGLNCQRQWLFAEVQAFRTAQRSPHSVLEFSAVIY
jgi:hypothetical protein